MADWVSVAKMIAPFAPTAGRLIGGFVPFPGAAAIGGMLGDAVAAALGVPADPEAVVTAAQGMSPQELEAKLAAVEADAKAKWEAMAHIAEVEAGDRTAQSQAINETQRAETASGVAWWHWRHLIGYAALLWFMVPLPAFMILTFRYSNEAAKQLTDIIGACVPIYGFISGLLGYVAQDTTKLRMTAMTGTQAPSLIDNAVGAVKGVITKVKKK